MSTGTNTGTDSGTDSGTGTGTSRELDLAAEVGRWARRVAAARAQHPSSSVGDRPVPGADSVPDGPRLAVVKPIRTPAGPEGWSAGLWGSFA
ncbi:MAG: hypothetical protein V7605_2305 [Acidimicrobiaceae bacterium]|jgi:hypothetical protein